MEGIVYPRAGTYVVAVSGGIDSVALLDLLAQQKDLKLIVAHVDHGIRKDSAKNARFVKQLAKKYNLTYEQKTLALGPHVSEEQARSRRYEYLFQLMEETQSSAIITAHHADDVVETMVINLLRGTGWRGLASLISSGKVLRPFVVCRKSAVADYIDKGRLDYYHDTTNDSDIYTRNYVRRNIIPKLRHDEWYRLYQAQAQLKADIDGEVQRLHSFRRYDYIMWPRSVALEVLRSLLPLTRIQADYALHAIKTAKNDKEIEVGSGYKIVFNRDDFIVVDPIS